MPSTIPRVRTRSFAAGSIKHTLIDELRLVVEYRPAEELKPAKRRFRIPSKRVQEHLQATFLKFGFFMPVTIDRDDRVIDNYEVVLAAAALGVQVPTVKLSHVTPEQAELIQLFIPKVKSLYSWDDQAVKDSLKGIVEVDVELLTYTAFSSAEIDAILNTPEDPDDATTPLREPAVSRLHDIWLFEGGHRLGCFDALKGASYMALLADERAQLALCDPPYNVFVRGHVTGRKDAREFAMASGEMTSDEFITFLSTYLAHLVRHTVNGALFYQWIDWRHMSEMLAAGNLVHLALLNLAVWAKPNPGMGSLYRSAHELCFIWKTGEAPYCNMVQLGRNGRNRSNVWQYEGANSFSSQDDRDGRGHMTPKNVAMFQDAILDVTRRGDIVLDSFVGSGTTLLAAHRAKRRGFGLELDPLYVDLAVRRMEARTKAPARHAETGLTFAEMAAERGVARPTRTRSR